MVVGAAGCIAALAYLGFWAEDNPFTNFREWYWQYGLRDSDVQQSLIQILLVCMPALLFVLFLSLHLLVPLKGFPDFSHAQALIAVCGLWSFPFLLHILVLVLERRFWHYCERANSSAEHAQEQFKTLLGTFQASLGMYVLNKSFVRIVMR